MVSSVFLSVFCEVTVTQLRRQGPLDSVVGLVEVRAFQGRVWIEPPHAHGLFT